ncbi:MAG: hypothetical protein HN929_00150 [Chloroflexi bacterium]|jgi:hypothetical protein|nr:hypothetical protein [Chloroflexota bacterium]
MMQIPTDQLKDYLKRSGTEDFNGFSGELEIAEHGFCNYRIGDDYIVVYHMYGNGSHWDDFLTNLAVRNNKSRILLTTKRNPATIMRKFDFEIQGYIMQKEIKNGRNS